MVKRNYTSLGISPLIIVRFSKFKTSVADENVLYQLVYTECRVRENFLPLVGHFV